LIITGFIIASGYYHHLFIDWNFWNFSISFVVFWKQTNKEGRKQTKTINNYFSSVVLIQEM